MLETALALTEHGFAVFPCRPRAKWPATPHGFKDASKDQAVIRQWWASNPHYNIAVATGEISGCFVVDVDGLEGYAELGRLETQFGDLPNTLTACTADGQHLYFKWPGKPVPCSAGKIAFGIDVRGDGGYCLVPPSTHPSGRRYAWSVDSGSEIATAPDWLLDRAIGHNGDGKCATPVEEWRAIAAKGAVEGTRDCTATRLAGHLLRKDIDAVVVLELLHCWNTTRCVPPLPTTHIERICNSVAAKELRRRLGG